jgi:hypothetical protein
MRNFLAVTLALTVATCGGALGDDACRGEPVGSVRAFFPGSSPSRDLTAVVETITPLPELQGMSYLLRDDSGAVSKLSWLAPSPMAGVRRGERYRFIVEYEGGFPDSSSVKVMQGDSLIFAGFTDQKIPGQVMKGGLAGFEIAIGSERCSSRGRTDCHEASVNLPLIVRHGGSRVELYHGQTASLGGYIVRALTVQRVDYSSRCADAGVPAVSFTIERK